MKVFGFNIIIRRDRPHRSGSKAVYAFYPGHGPELVARGDALEIASGADTCKTGKHFTVHDINRENAIVAIIPHDCIIALEPYK